MKKIFLSSLFLACMPTVLFGQTNEEYVYVTENIDFSGYTTDPPNPFVLQKNPAKYKTWFSATSVVGCRAAQFTDSYGFVTIESAEPFAYLKNINIKYKTTLTKENEGGCKFYGKTEAYTNYSDVSKDNLRGDVITPLQYSITEEGTQLITFEPRYRYWGLNQPSSNAAIAIESFTVTWQLLYNRANLTVGNIGTLCLPYSVKASDMDGITLYDIAGKTTDGNGNVTSIVFDLADHIEAGHPYLFVAEQEEIFLPFCGEKTTEPTSYKGMHGVFERYPFADDTNYTEGNYVVISKNALQTASNKSGVNANCAYICIDEVPVLDPSQSGKRILTLTDEGFSQSSITPLLFDDPSSSSNAHTFDLNGRQVATGKTNTITISNGKKTILR